MTRYTVKWSELGDKILSTKTFTWPTAAVFLVGYSNKWMASCVAMVDYSCRGRAYTGLDIAGLTTVAVAFGLFTWSISIALDTGYRELMKNYITEAEREE